MFAELSDGTVVALASCQFTSTELDFKLVLSALSFDVGFSFVHAVAQLGRSLGTRLMHRPLAGLCPLLLLIAHRHAVVEIVLRLRPLMQGDAVDDVILPLLGTPQRQINDHHRGLRILAIKLSLLALPIPQDSADANAADLLLSVGAVVGVLHQPSVAVLLLDPLVLPKDHRPRGRNLVVRDLNGAVGKNLLVVKSPR